MGDPRARRWITAAAASAAVLAAALFGGAVPAAAHGAGDIFQASGAVYTIAWSADGTMFAAGTDTGNITVYDGVRHFEKARWHGHDGPINEVVFSPDGTKLASASGAYKSTTKEASLKVWNLTGALLLNITDHYDWVVSAAWSPDGSMIASSSGVDSHDDLTKVYGEVKFWNSSTGVLVWNASARTPAQPENGSYPARIAWAPDGHAVAALGHLNDLWLLYPYENPRRMDLINHSYHDVVGHASHGWAVSWSPDSRYVVGGFSYDYTRPGATTGDYLADGATDSGPIIVFDPNQRTSEGFARQVFRADVHSKPVTWVSWDSRGQFLASCSGADLINTTGGTVRGGQDGDIDAAELIIYNFSASTQGRLAAVNVWIFATSWCSAVDFQPGNQTVAAGSADGTIKVYVFDEDGDGCWLWNPDDAPLDPTVCRAPQAVKLNFFEQWGVWILAFAAAAVVAGGLVAIRRSTQASRNALLARGGPRSRNQRAGRGRRSRRR